MKREKIFNFLKETGALITYCLIINVILAIFYITAEYINIFYLIDLNNNIGYIFAYAIILVVVLMMSIIIEPYKFSKKADIEFVRSYLKIAAEPNYFCEIFIYLFSVLCTFMLGLALGTQGPSLYVGILTSLLVYKFIFKTTTMSKNEQVLLGAGVGFSIAFTNPIAGMTLALERAKLKVSMQFIFKLSFALIFSFFLQFLFRDKYLCEYFIEFESHMNYWLLFIVPAFVLIACVLGLSLKKLFLILRKHIDHDNKVVKIIMYSLIVILPVLIKIYNPHILGGGVLTISWIFSDLALGIFAIYGAIRIVFTLFSFETNFSGGMGGCIIVIGMIIGRFFAGLLGLVMVLSESDVFALIIATALPFYGITTKEKYTSFALIFSFGNFLYIAAPVTVGFATMLGISKTLKVIKKKIDKNVKVKAA